MNSIQRRLYPLIVCVAAILCRASCPAAPEPAASRPNFIIIFTDDQGYQDLGVFGSPNIQTPHIDQMAKEGRIFTSFYVSSPLCSASRAALLTGSYPKRLGMERAVFFPQDNTGIHQDEVTLADMLKPAGYATACIGKWHIGHQKPFLPTSQGFDYYYGIPYSNDMTHPDNKQRPRYGKWDVYWKDQAASVTQWHTPLMENEEIIEMPVDQRTITRRYTDRAIDFVSSNRDNPFFLYLAHSMPHVPLYVPDEVYAETSNPYEVTIEHIDAETGRLLDTIRNLGLDKNTYVIFTSDNGPWLKFNHHAGSAKPLSGGKGWFQEGGIRVPCVMWGPGRIPADTRTDEMASTLDLFPTLATLAGVQPETRGPIDGLDVSGLMTGTEPSPRTELLYYSDQTLFGMRKGDWKIIGRDLNKNPALYNLADDLAEQKNLARTHPEKLAELKARAQELDAQITKEMRTLGVYSPAAKAPPPARKSYKGRVIAQTMHWEGAEWLLRKEREREESTQMMIQNLGLKPGQTVCDLGSGNGYHTLMMSNIVGENGRVLAVDIQQEMLTMLVNRAKSQGIHNVEPILGKLHDPMLPENELDLVLAVDAYHEFSHPEEMLRAVRKSLKPGGQLALIEFRMEDSEVPIKRLHKMSKEQIMKELPPNGFKLVREFNELPWQHMMFFERVPIPDGE